MASVILNGHTYTDDANPTTGMANGGHRDRFIPCLADMVVENATQLASCSTQATNAANSAITATNQAAAAAASATSAVLAPGTSATSSDTKTITHTGSMTFSIQSDKSFVVGQFVTIAYTTTPTEWMFGQITSYSGTTLIVNLTASSGHTSSRTGWTIGLAGPDTMPSKAGKAGQLLVVNDTATGVEWTDNSYYPNTRPSFLADFANSQVINPYLSFSRLSTATYIDSIGNLVLASIDEPRFEYDITTGLCRGLLIEASYTNIQIHSEDFSQSTYTKTGVTVSANSAGTFDPYGSTSLADKLVEQTTTGTHGFTCTSSITATSAQSFSLFVKRISSGDRDRIKLTLEATGATPNYVSAVYELSTGTVVGSVVVGGTATSYGARIYKLANDWYRVAISGVCISSGGTTVTCKMDLIDTATNTSYTGNASYGMYVFGTQIEQEAYPTSYISTGASSVTRLADSCTCASINLNKWYKQGEGSIYCEFSVLGNAVASTRDPNIINFSNVDFSNYISLRVSNSFPTLLAFTIMAANIVQVDIFKTISADQKYALYFSTNSCNIIKNNDSNTEDTSATIPSVDRFALGNRAASANNTNYLNGYISKFAYYPRKFSTVQLQKMTTS